MFFWDTLLTITHWLTHSITHYTSRASCDAKNGMKELDVNRHASGEKEKFANIIEEKRPKVKSYFTKNQLPGISSNIQAVYFHLSCAFSFPKSKRSRQTTGPNLPTVLPSAVSSALLGFHLQLLLISILNNHTAWNRWKKGYMEKLPWEHQRWQEHHKGRWKRWGQEEGSSRLEELPGRLFNIYLLLNLKFKISDF